MRGMAGVFSGFKLISKEWKAQNSGNGRAGLVRMKERDGWDRHGCEV